MRLTRADLRQLGRRPSVNPVERDPTMAPTRGLTPVITGPGHRTFMHFEAKGSVIKCWNDARDRVPIIWIPPEACVTWEDIRDRLGHGS